MDIRATLMELCQAFNAHALDRIMTFFADDCVLEMPRGTEPWGSRAEGKQKVKAALATRFEGLPDVHYGNDEHFVDVNTGSFQLPCRRWGCFHNHLPRCRAQSAAMSPLLLSLRRVMFL